MTRRTYITTLTIEPATIEPKRKNHFAPFVIGGLVLATGALLYDGDTIAHWRAAGDECIKFANENEAHVAWNPAPDAKIFAASQWLKGRYVVVQLAQQEKNKNKNKNKNKKGFSSRLCIVGGGYIQMPSIIEAWEKR